MTKVQSKNAILFDIENDAGPLRDAMVATIGEGTALDPGLISAIDKAKLDGIAAGATANATDAALRDRATHTGEQAIGTITGLVDALAGKATPADVAAALAGLVDSSPATLDTLNELAAALGDDPAFATTVSTALGNRLRVDAAQGLTAPQQAQGRDNLGLGSAALEDAATFATAAQGAKADQLPATLMPLTIPVTNAAGTLREDLPAPQVRSWLDTIVLVETRAAMKGLDPLFDTVCYLAEDGRQGPFKWSAADHTADVIADPQEGIHVKATAIDSSLGAWKRTYDGLIVSTWFGIAQAGSAATNKTAMQAAINYVAQQTNVERRTLHTPAGNYSIEGTITIPQSALQVCLTGDGRFATVFLHTGAANVLFHIKGEGAFVQGFAIQRSGGPVAGDGTRAFLVKKDYGTIDPETGVMPTADADFGLTQMRISGYDIGVEFWGRGLQTGDTDWGVCDWSYDVYWPDVGDYTEGSQAVQKDATGFRYFHLHSSRAHSNLSGFMRNTGSNAAKINGVHISGISMDIGRTLYEGVLRQGIIADFAVTQTPVPAIKLKAGSENFRITGGTVQGDTDAARVPPHFIEMTGSMSSGHISGMTLRNCTSHGIYHDGTDGEGGASGTGVATDMVITDIDFVEPCTTVVGANPIRFNGPDHTVYTSDITIDVAIALQGIIRGTASSASLRVGRTRSLRAFTPPIASGSLGTAMAVDQYTSLASGGNYLEFKAHDGTLKSRLAQGASALWLVVNDANNIWMAWGAGSPEGVQTAGIGSVYWDITNGVQYNKKTGTGNTGWKLVTQTA